MRKVITMPDNFVSKTMFDTFFPIFVLIGLAGVAALGFLVLSLILGRRTKSTVKEEPYESGMVPTGDTRERFSIKFYLVTILFIVFDIEVIFLYPWAVIYNELALFGLISVLGILSVWPALNKFNFKLRDFVRINVYYLVAMMFLLLTSIIRWPSLPQVSI